LTGVLSLDKWSYTGDVAVRRITHGEEYEWLRKQVEEFEANL